MQILMLWYDRMVVHISSVALDFNLCLLGFSADRCLWDTCQAAFTHQTYVGQVVLQNSNRCE